MQQRDATFVPQAKSFSSEWQLPVHPALNAQTSTLLSRDPVLSCAIIIKKEG